MTKARDTASLVSSQTGIAVTISGDPVILGVGNTQHVAIQGSGRIGIGTVITGGNYDVYKLEVYSEANDVLSGSIRANNLSVLPAAGAYVTVNSGSGTSGAGGGWAAWNHNYSTTALAGYVGNIAFSSSKGLLLAAGTADQNIKILGLNYSETARFTSDHKVGIGTTNPGGPLHILGDGGATPQLTLHAKGDKTANWILFKDDGGNTGFVGYGSNDDDLLSLWNYTNEGIRLGTNSTERVRITSGGVVSVGSAATTGTPNQTFQVMNGGAYFNGAVAIGRTAVLASYVLIDAYGTGRFGANDNITPDSNAKGHIMTNFSGYTGFIAGDASSMYLGHNSSGRDLSFMTNETTRMVIAGSQNTVGIGYTNLSAFAGSYRLAVNGHIYISGSNYVDWNSGDARISGNQSSGGYGLNIKSYNASLTRDFVSIYINGTNKAVGINTDYTRSDYGLFVQLENKGLGDSEGAIYAYGNVFCNRQYKGGFGAISTGGTADWNDSTNARPGNGFTLLLGSATNGPGPGNYYHAFSFEYGTKSGSGNLTQMAIPYYVSSDQEWYYRTRYNGTWSSWYAI